MGGFCKRQAVPHAGAPEPAANLFMNSGRQPVRQQQRALAMCFCALALQLVACSKQTAEEKAKEMATEKVDMAKGIGDVLQEKGTAAAESVTSGMGKVEVDFVAQGNDKTPTK